MFFLQILINGIVQGTAILLIAVPLYLIHSVGKFFHIGIGALSTAVAYLFYLAFIRSGNMVLATGFALIGGLAMAAASLAILEPYVQKRQTLFALLVSFSMGVAVEALVAMGFGADGKSILRGVLPTVEGWGLRITVPGLVIVGCGFVFFLLAVLLVKGTPFGRILGGLAENSAVAESLGTHSQKMRFWAYTVAIWLAGFIAVMSGMNTALTPGMGFDPVVMAFIALLVGGVASLRGLLIASYLLALVPQFLVSFSGFTASWKMVLVFLVAAGILAFRPKGLFAPILRHN